MTENGTLRILELPENPAAVAPLLRAMRSLNGHVFWSDDISLLDKGKVNTTHLLSSAQTTDCYLFALAQAHGGQLATFDRRLVVTAVHGGADALYLINLTQ